MDPEDGTKNVGAHRIVAEEDPYDLPDEEEDENDEAVQPFEPPRRVNGDGVKERRSGRLVHPHGVLNAGMAEHDG